MPDLALHVGDLPAYVGSCQERTISKYKRRRVVPHRLRLLAQEYLACDQPRLNGRAEPRKVAPLARAA
jgi:hypothetical protein